MPQGWNDTAGIWAAQGPVPAVLVRDDGGLVEISTYLRRTADPRRRMFSPGTRDRNGRFWDLEKYFTVIARSLKRASWKTNQKSQYKGRTNSRLKVIPF